MASVVTVIAWYWSPLLAQVPAAEWAPVAQLGIAGGMLFWFMRFVDTKMKSLEVAVDRMARASVLQILAIKMTSAAGVDIQEQAKSILTEIDEKQRNK